MPDIKRMVLETARLDLVLQGPQETRARIELMGEADKAQVSPVWLARLEASTAPDPWIHGFTLQHRESGASIGSAGFTGPPSAEGVVEIAYQVEQDHQGKGYATEAAAALTRFALETGQVKTVIAHTLPQTGASSKVLTKCGFQHVGGVIHPEDGKVWKWEKHAP